MENITDIKTRIILYILITIAVIFIYLYISSAILFIILDLDDNYLKPWSIIEIFMQNDEEDIFNAILISVFLPLCLFCVFIGFTYSSKNKLHGNAKFASHNEIRKKGLLKGVGIILGKIGSKFLVADGTEHILVAAPTRSGKGVGIVIPNLLNWDQSCVVLDIKLENFKATSGFRKKHGHKVFLWSPSDKSGTTHCYNPLDVIDKHNKHLRIDDIQKIGTFLCPTPLDGDPMWANEGRNLFIAIVLYLIDTNSPVTLGECNRFIKSYSNEELEELINSHDDLDNICTANFTNFISMGDKQASGVKSTLTSSLSLFDNPIIDAMTSSTDFSFSDLRKTKMAIYVGITPDKLGTLAPLLNLFFQQCCDILISSLPEKEKEPYKVLMLLDEFTSLGKMDIIKDGIAYFAGYNLRLMPIIQSPQQLYDKYGERGAKAMISNFMYQIVFAPNNYEDADDISKRLGTKTVKTKSKTRSIDSSGSTSTSETSRALMLPQEILQMNRKDSLILIEAMEPIKAKKVIYFSDPHFAGRFYNVFDPSKNIGELPVKIPKQKIVASQFKKDIPAPSVVEEPEQKLTSLYDKNNSENIATTTEKEEIEDSDKESSLFDGFEDLLKNNTKPEKLTVKKIMDNSELEDLVSSFWATAQ